MPIPVGVPAPADLVSSARTLVDIHERIRRHALSETVPDVDGVMATVTPVEQLTWSKTLAWSLYPGPEGPEKIRVRTTVDEVREFYEWRMSMDLPQGSKPGLSNIRGGWYAFNEAHPTPMIDVNTGDVSRVVEALSFFNVDGRDGISSEIVWIRSDDVALDAATRVARGQDYVDALSAEDPGRLVGLMTPGVLGAVRNYVDAEPPFVAIHGHDEMKDYYERLFRRFAIENVAVIQRLVREWFVFHELFLTMRARTSSGTGREFACRVAEYLTFDETGLFRGRCGYGTELQPI
jgi:hypothetical protein